jgi:hypothetical protein
LNQLSKSIPSQRISLLRQEEEPQTVPSIATHDNSFSVSPINMENQEVIHPYWTHNNKKAQIIHPKSYENMFVLEIMIWHPLFTWSMICFLSLHTWSLRALANSANDNFLHVSKTILLLTFRNFHIICLASKYFKHACLNVIFSFHSLFLKMSCKYHFYYFFLLVHLLGLLSTNGCCDARQIIWKLRNVSNKIVLETCKKLSLALFKINQHPYWTHNNKKAQIIHPKSYENMFVLEIMIWHPLFTHYFLKCLVNIIFIIFFYWYIYWAC